MTNSEKEVFEILDQHCYELYENPASVIEACCTAYLEMGDINFFFHAWSMMNAMKKSVAEEFKSYIEEVNNEHNGEE